jgi:hypothetical protein
MPNNFMRDENQTQLRHVRVFFAIYITMGLTLLPPLGHVCFSLLAIGFGRSFLSVFHVGFLFRFQHRNPTTKANSKQKSNSKKRKNPIGVCEPKDEDRLARVHGDVEGASYSMDTIFGDNEWTFQQDGAPGHKAIETQAFLRENCPDFIKVDTHWRNADGDWPPLNSPDLNPLDYAVWSILEEKACTKPHKNVESLERAKKVFKKFEKI